MLGLAQSYKASVSVDANTEQYGLQSAFSRITLLSHQVTSAGNPLKVELSNQYVVKGINKEQTVNSVVNIWTRSDGKIEKVEDRWDDKLPSGPFQDTLRKLNAVSVPKMVGVPKDAEEDANRPRPLA
jgi:hypothetical protein